MRIAKLASVSEQALTGQTGAGRKTRILATLIHQFCAGAAIRNILVVGCGSGDDARALAEYFNASVEAIDLDNYFAATADSRVRYTQMDACRLTFPDVTFDVVYSFHALEHIPDYKTAILEMRRVLKPSGTYCIGTPNRTRVAGYVGVPGYSFHKKVRSNFHDWGQRLQGRFRNEFGAHAGFTEEELLTICSVIGPGRCIQNEYYANLYSRQKRMIEAIRLLGFGWFAWPSVYILGNCSKAEV